MCVHGKTKRERERDREREKHAHMVVPLCIHSYMLLGHKLSIHCKIHLSGCDCMYFK